MKHRILALTLLVGTLVSGCKTKSNTTSRALKGNVPFTISLERTPCFGTCPVYIVSLHSDGKLTYIGKEFSNLKGEYETYLPLDEVQKIKAALIDLNFLKLEDSYDNVYISDLPSAITTLIINGKVVKTVKNRFNPPPQLVRFELMIDNLWRSEFEANQ